MSHFIGAAPTGMFGLAPPSNPHSLPSMWSSEGAAPLAADSSHATHGQWSPYEMNGGTSLGIAGPDYAVIAADTRLSEGYSILSRQVSKVAVLTDACVIGTGGCWSDVYTLHKVLKTRVAAYALAHGTPISSPALSQLLATELYGRRFFPYYAFNVVAGLDSDGKGAVFTYDAVGSFERVEYAAQGAGQKLMIPLLDELVGFKNRSDPKEKLSVEQAVEMAKEAFLTAGERDIYTGDDIEIFAITKAGVTRQVFSLKKD